VAKYLARLGLCSRREAEKWIQNKSVAINGQTVLRPGDSVNQGDTVHVNGHLIKPTRDERRTRMWIFHKPRGVLTANTEASERTTTAQMLRGRSITRNLDLPPHLVTVGRLDYNSEGLLLLTNNGALARALELPKGGVPRTYAVRLHSTGRLEPKLRKIWGQQALVKRLAAGITVNGVRYGSIILSLLGDEDKAFAPDLQQSRRGSQAKSVKGRREEQGAGEIVTPMLEDPTSTAPERKGPANQWIKVTLTEGKNREIRKVFEHLEMPVSRIIRLGYGPLRLGDLARGNVIEVKQGAVKKLMSSLNMEVENVLDGLEIKSDTRLNLT